MFDVYYGESLNIRVGKGNSTYCFVIYIWLMPGNFIQQSREPWCTLVLSWVNTVSCSCTFFLVRSQVHCMFSWTIIHMLLHLKECVLDLFGPVHFLCLRTGTGTLGPSSFHGTQDIAGQVRLIPMILNFSSHQLINNYLNIMCSESVNIYYLLFYHHRNFNQMFFHLSSF